MIIEFGLIEVLCEREEKCKINKNIQWKARMQRRIPDLVKVSDIQPNCMRGERGHDAKRVIPPSPMQMALNRFLQYHT